MENHLLQEEKRRRSHQKDLLLPADDLRLRVAALVGLLAALVSVRPLVDLDRPMGYLAVEADAHGPLDSRASVAQLQPWLERPADSLRGTAVALEAQPDRPSKAKMPWARLDVLPIVLAGQGSGRKAPSAESEECDVRPTWGLREGVLLPPGLYGNRLPPSYRICAHSATTSS